MFGCRVVLDEPAVIALYQPTGAPISRRLGPRGGPRGRSLPSSEWDGRRSIETWGYRPTVRLHPVGKSYAVIRTWVEADQDFAGWYVNLEQPWTRTEVGFDSRDDVLDVVVTDDLGECNLKDEDELAFSVESGVMTKQEAEQIRHTAREAIEDVQRRRWPFDPQAWASIRPIDLGTRLEFPEGWDRPA